MSNADWFSSAEPLRADGSLIDKLRDVPSNVRFALRMLLRLKVGSLTV